jgi:hypothetical protein
MPRYINPAPQYLDSQGDLLVEGFLRFEESGTNTLKPVYHDASLTIQADNPVKLDGAGRCPSLFTSGSYKVTAFKNDGVGGLGEQQWERDPVGSESGEFGADWDSASTYGRTDIVRANEKYYESLINNNVGNNPETTPSAWSQLVWFHAWNSLETYAQFDLVKGSDGLIYSSVIGSNLGNDPTTDDGTKWRAGVLDSTDARKGVALKSTQAKVDAGTDDDSYVTPLQLASKPVFRGVTAYQTANISIPTGVETAVPYNGEVYDTDGFHDNVTNNTRITIPAGVGYVQIVANVRWFNIWTAGTNQSLRIKQNGASIPGIEVQHAVNPSQRGASKLDVQTTSPVVPCSEGDYFEVFVTQDSGVSQSILGNASNSRVWVGLTVFE